jgi:hypothetical protein
MCTVPQPDNCEHIQQGGEEEACLAVLNNFYRDCRFTEYMCTVRQPDNMSIQQGGEEGACLAVLNNFYGDGRFTEYMCTVRQPDNREQIQQ